MDWTYAQAINPGVGKETPEDVCLVGALDGGGLAIVVSDGAGSARRGGDGALITCQTFVENAQALLLAADPKTEFSLVLKETVSRIDLAAEEAGGQRSEYACTLIAAFVSAGGTLFAQIGDGAAVFQAGGDFEVAIWPEEMEYLNVSRFVTDPNAAEHLKHRWVTETVQSLALFSDGLQHLIIDPKERKPHAPFFERVFRTIEASNLVGVITKDSRSKEDRIHNERASAWLHQMLQSEFVTSRTDDDTSIVIARRHG